MFVLWDGFARLLRIQRDGGGRGGGGREGGERETERERQRDLQVFIIGVSRVR